MALAELFHFICGVQFSDFAAAREKAIEGENFVELFFLRVLMKTVREGSHLKPK